MSQLACRTTGLHAGRAAPLSMPRPAAHAHLSLRITQQVPESRRFDYRRIWQLMRRKSLYVLHKRF